MLMAVVLAVHTKPLAVGENLQVMCTLSCTMCSHVGVVPLQRDAVT